MAATGARAVAQIVRPHIALIKFPSRGALAKVENIAPSPLKGFVSPTPAASSSSNKPIGSTPRGSGIDFQDLPSKYKRKPMDQMEIDYIMRGGPE